MRPGVPDGLADDEGRHGRLRAAPGHRRHRRPDRRRLPLHRPRPALAAHRSSEAIDDRRLPESWLEIDDQGQEVVASRYRNRLPRAVTVDPYGNEGDGELEAAFIPAPFLFCLHCGVSYEQVRGKDFAKLATLDQEGRSSATSLVSASIVRSLKAVPAEALDKKARKLLTFVDNRQDASLQAGHFNDFVQVTQLRGALYRAAVEAGDGRHPPRGARRPGSPTRSPWRSPTTPAPRTWPRRSPATPPRPCGTSSPSGSTSTWSAAGGSPCPTWSRPACCEIDYEDLDWLAEQQDRWAERPAGAARRRAGPRAEIMRALLDEMRRALAIDVQYFRDDFDTLQRASEERLVDPWVLVDERPAPGRHRLPAGLDAGHGPLGSVPVRRAASSASTCAAMHFHGAVDRRRSSTIIDGPAEGAGQGRPGDQGRARPRSARGGTGAAPASRSPATGSPRRALIWRAGTGETGAHDPLTRTYASGDGPRVNPFFRDLYRSAAGALGGLAAREHTAQVAPEEREQREEAFRKAELQAALLLADDGAGRRHLRAQRRDDAQRAADPGQLRAAQRPGGPVRASPRSSPRTAPPATATTSTTSAAPTAWSPAPSPRRASTSPTRTWSAPTCRPSGSPRPGSSWAGPSPRSSTSPTPRTPARPTPRCGCTTDITAALRDTDAQRRAAAAARQVLGGAAARTSRETTWWHDQWIEDTVRTAAEQFDRGLRPLARAVQGRARSTRPSRTAGSSTTPCPNGDRSAAVRRRREAETQLNLLKNESVDSKSVLSDFNPYRYLASEGFLPGYSFPRLPLAAYIPTAGAPVRRRRLPAAAPLPRDPRVRPRRADLPRGRPLPGHADPAAAGRLRRRGHQRGQAAAPRCGYHHDVEDGADLCEMCERAAAAQRRTACCSCTPSTPSAASGSPPTRRSAAGPASGW